MVLRRPASTLALLTLLGTAWPAALFAQAPAPGASPGRPGLAELQAGCRGDCRLEQGETQRVGGDELTVIGRQQGTAALEVGLHSGRAGLLPAGRAASHIAALLAGRSPAIDEAKAAARLLLALRLQVPAARIVTTPEELPRLPAVARRRVRQDSWPRTDPRPAGRFLVTAIVHRQHDGKNRVDRLLMVVDPAEQWLAGSEVLHCDPGFAGGCALVSLP